MQVIRLQRTGRKNQPSFRIVLAEKSDAVNGKFQEVLGSYNPSEGKKLTFDKDRIAHWVSMGARPSDAVAAILKNNGMDGMDKFLAPRDKKRAKKNPEEVLEEAPAEAPAEGGEEAAPAEEAPAAEEAPKEEAPAEEPAKEEEPAAEEAPAPAPEETPAE